MKSGGNLMDAIQAAEEQSLFRKVNERVWAISNSLDAMQDVKFLCECARRDCAERVSMSLTAYEELRRVPTHFAVFPNMGHVFPEVERIFAKREGYFVLEKLGEAGVEATKLDPSRRNASTDSIWQPDLGECIGSGVYPLRESEQLETDGSTTGICPGCLERSVLSNDLIPAHQPPGNASGEDDEELGKRI
jgi:hypothetical protein